MGSTHAEVTAVPIRLDPVCEVRWSYTEFTKLMPHGPDSEGQAYAVAPAARILGDRLAGSGRLSQFPRWRADGLYLPNSHGLITTESGQQVITNAGGYVIPVPDADGRWTIAHWMRFWTSAPGLDWLNATVAIGAGIMADDEARVRYYAAAPAAEPTELPEGAPRLNLLGTAHWEYPEYEAVRPFGDNEGIGMATSTGRIEGGPLTGAWSGWHYPTYVRNGLYQIDAHVAIDGPRGLILNRHTGLGVRPADPAGGVKYGIVQHATFVTEASELADLNRTLAVGVGHARDPGVVDLSYYAVSG